MSTITPQDAWQAALGQLELQLDRATYNTYLQGAELFSYEDGSFVVSVRNAYAKNWLEQQIYRSLQRILADMLERTVEVLFMVYDPVEEVQDFGPLWQEEALAQEAHAEIAAQAQLNPGYTFDAFVVGSSNQFVNAAAHAVADQPGQSYNPLFIYGDVGLGKTHLLHAIGNALCAQGLRVLYVTSEQFTNDLIAAIRAQDTVAFRDTYRTVDVLLVDDVQFIAGKDSTQDEFFHTFNDLHRTNRQIVLASDRRPRAMKTLEERLRSRFEWGLIADIQPPDFEMRTAILEHKAQDLNLPLPEEIAQQIARDLQGSIRELESVLTQLTAQVNLFGRGLTPDLAKSVLKEYRAPRKTHTLEDVLQTTAEFHGLSIDELVGKRRTKKVAGARHQAMYLAREATEASLPQIGEVLGGRDHTTILHGVNKVTEQIETDEHIRQEIKQLRLKLFDED